jgi:hypothetical protein
MDQNCDFESIYIETTDPSTKDIINLLIDIPALVQILVRDLTIDWAALVTNWRMAIFPYIKRCVKIDTTKGSIQIRNTEDISNLVV